MYRDASQVWDHDHDCEVTDVHNDGKNIKVLVKTKSPAHVGDKLTGRYGNKGVVAIVVPDEEMPYVKGTNRRLDIIMNPMGVPSRINPAQKPESLLGKVALETNRKKPYIIEHFSKDDNSQFALDEANKAGVNADKETIVFPKENREVKAMTGVSYIWKLSKLSEGELKKRELGGYDVDQQPVKGKGDHGQALRIGGLEVNALIGHDAKHNLREISTIKGQRDDEFWRANKLGLPLPQPKVPFVYEKFNKMLEGSGINVQQDGEKVRLLPMTDKDILGRSRGEIKNGELLYTKNMMPIKGGLFDPSITGGTVGKNWSHIRLEEALPHPVMEEPIKKILGMNKREFNQAIEKNTLGKSLSSIDLDREISTAEQDMRYGKGGKRDAAIKKIGYLGTMKEHGIKPKDLMLRNVPVIPPIFRPISAVGEKQTISPGNANLLYKDMVTTNEALKVVKSELPDEDLGAERLTNYKAMKAIVGLGDPVNLKNQNKRVRGFIADIVGDQPKSGFFQRKLLSKTQDLVSRGVATPDPGLNIDQVSLPHDTAWKQFGPFVQRRMVQRGYNALRAAEEIENRSPVAMDNLKAEMAVRPVLMNRNPSLHKFNVMAFNAQLNNDKVIKTAPAVASGFNLDHDGDQVNLHVTVTPEAVREAREKMMPSKNLYHIKDRKVHFLPVQGSIMGLYSLTQPGKSKTPKKTYGSIDDLKKDFRAGLIHATDTVEVPI